MKFIHTADWHIGKTLKNAQMIDEQNYILNGEFLKLVDDEKVDAVIIAGDIYDRSVPPIDAVNLLDEIIFKLIEKNIFVLCISGNHDSASRLNFGSRLMTKSNFFITAKPKKNPTPIILQDNFGEIYFSLIPFFNPIEIEEIFGKENFSERLTSEDAYKIYIAESRKKIPAEKRSVAIAHLFAAGGITSESERKFVGGVENISAENFSSYNYTALGHLHKPQNMKKTGFTVRYSGSPLKYSFDEAEHEKGFTVVDIDGEGKISYEHIKITPRRDVRVVEGKLEDLKKLPKSEDYIHANLTDKKYIFNVMETLRENVFPNILSLKFTNIENVANKSSAEKFKDGSSIFDHFKEFFENKSGEKFDEDYKNAMKNLLKEI